MGEQKFRFKVLGEAGRRLSLNTSGFRCRRPSLGMLGLGFRVQANICPLIYPLLLILRR